MKDYYGDSGASGFEAEYPYNVIKEYDNLIADLKSTYYAKETQLDQLVHMLKVATKENFCHLSIAVSYMSLQHTISVTCSFVSTYVT